MQVSKFLRKYATSPSSQKGTLGDFIEGLGSSSFALVILILSLPQAGPWPMPPGMSAIMGLPILFISLQLVWGNTSIWLPEKLNKKRFSAKRIKTIVGKIVPIFVWLEKFLRPRLDFMFSAKGMRLIGGVIALLALIMALPIPGGNFVPGLLICLLSLSVLQRDGLLAIGCMIGTIVLTVVMYALIGSAMDTVAGWF